MDQTHLNTCERVLIAQLFAGATHHVAAAVAALSCAKEVIDTDLPSETGDHVSDLVDSLSEVADKIDDLRLKSVFAIMADADKSEFRPYLSGLVADVGVLASQAAATMETCNELMWVITKASESPEFRRGSVVGRVELATEHARHAAAQAKVSIFNDFSVLAWREEPQREDAAASKGSE